MALMLCENLLISEAFPDRRVSICAIGSGVVLIRRCVMSRATTDAPFPSVLRTKEN